MVQTVQNESSHVQLLDKVDMPVVVHRQEVLSYSAENHGFSAGAVLGRGSTAGAGFSQQFFRPRALTAVSALGGWRLRRE